MNTTIVDGVMSSFSAAMTAVDDAFEDRVSGGGTFFRQNLTFSKFFNVSIPIGEKISIRNYEEVNQNILENLNRFDILPPLPPSTNFALFLSSLVLAMIWVKIAYGSGSGMNYFVRIRILVFKSFRITQRSNPEILIKLQ
jgi:hypothetical protein